MAQTEERSTDKVEVVGEWKAVQCREIVITKEDGVEVSRTFHRHVLHPDSDISGEPQATQDICNSVWTEELKESWIQYVKDTKPKFMEQT